MLGWHISIFKQADGGSLAARADSNKGARLAVWQADLGGLQWLDDLVEAGSAIHLGGDGYPFRYTARARHVIRSIVGGPPEARSTWAVGDHDSVTSQWAGNTVIDLPMIDQCLPDEWLLVEAWDES
jgi:hypothetical protein